MKSLHYLDINSCQVGKIHPVWQCGTDPVQVAMASTKARLLVQRYALSGTHVAGAQKKEKCPLCLGPPETLEHFILKCTASKIIRQPLVKKLKKRLGIPVFMPLKDEYMLQCILDCSKEISMSHQTRQDFEGITRRLLFALHNNRCISLGGSSSYVTATRKVPPAIEKR